MTNQMGMELSEIIAGKIVRMEVDRRATTIKGGIKPRVYLLTTPEEFKEMTEKPKPTDTKINKY